MIAEVKFVDGTIRPVFQDFDGRQYVIDDDGGKVYGIWFLPDEERVQPDAIVFQKGRS